MFTKRCRVCNCLFEFQHFQNVHHLAPEFRGIQRILNRGLNLFHRPPKPVLYSEIHSKKGRYSTFFFSFFEDTLLSFLCFFEKKPRVWTSLHESRQAKSKKQPRWCWRSASSIGAPRSFLLLSFLLVNSRGNSQKIRRYHSPIIWRRVWHRWLDSTGSIASTNTQMVFACRGIRRLSRRAMRS